MWTLWSKELYFAVYRESHPCRLSCSPPHYPLSSPADILPNEYYTKWFRNLLSPDFVWSRTRAEFLNGWHQASLFCRASIDCLVWRKSLWDTADYLSGNDSFPYSWGRRWILHYNLGLDISCSRWGSPQSFQETHHNRTIRLCIIQTVAETGRPQHSRGETWSCYWTLQRLKLRSLDLHRTARRIIPLTNCDSCLILFNAAVVWCNAVIVCPTARGYAVYFRTRVEMFSAHTHTVLPRGLFSYAFRP